MERHGLHPPGILSVTHFRDLLMSRAFCSWGRHLLLLFVLYRSNIQLKKLKVVFVNLCGRDCKSFSILNCSAVSSVHPSFENDVEAYTSQAVPSVPGILVSNDRIMAAHLLCLSFYSPRVVATSILINSGVGERCIWRLFWGASVIKGCGHSYRSLGDQRKLSDQLR